MISPLSHQAFKHSLASTISLPRRFRSGVIIFPALEKTRSHSADIAGMLFGDGRRPVGCGLEKATELQLHPKGGLCCGDADDHGVASAGYRRVAAEDLSIDEGG
jgi:hypothetical protein